MRIEITQAPEETVRDLQDLHYSQQTVDCLLQIGGKVIIAQQVWLTATEYEIGMRGNSIRFELRPTR